MIKAAIVDDDLEFLEMMSGELEKTQLFGEIKTYNDPQKLIATLGQIASDVLFLDIEMPNINGFSVAKALREQPVSPLIVYVTAEEHYMAEAFGFHVIGFLVKSKLQEQLAGMIIKINEEIAYRQVTVETTQGKISIRRDQILMLSCFNRKVTLTLQGGIKYELRGCVLNDAVCVLAMREYLVQINRSEVVNLMNVEKIKANTLFIRGLSQPLMISKYQKAEVLRRFSDYKVMV